MLETDRDNFYSILLAASKLYDKRLDGDVLGMYFNILNTYDFQSVKDGFNAAVRNLKFFPKPAEIVECIEGKEDDHIDFAYQEIKKIVYNGFHHAIKMANCLTMQVVADMGGLKVFYEKVYQLGENDTAAYFEFKRIYKKYYRMFKAGKFSQSVFYLPGYMDMLPGAAPVNPERLPLIGDGKAALRIGG